MYEVVAYIYMSYPSRKSVPISVRKYDKWRYADVKAAHVRQRGFAVTEGDEDVHYPAHRIHHIVVKEIENGLDTKTT